MSPLRRNEAALSDWAFLCQLNGVVHNVAMLGQLPCILEIQNATMDALTKSSSLEWQETQIFLFRPLSFGSSVAIRFKRLLPWGCSGMIAPLWYSNVSIHHDEDNNNALETALRTTAKCWRLIKMNYSHSDTVYKHLSTIMSKQIDLKRWIHSKHEYNRYGGWAMK